MHDVTHIKVAQLAAQGVDDVVAMCGHQRSQRTAVATKARCTRQNSCCRTRDLTCRAQRGSPRTNMSHTRASESPSLSSNGARMDGRSRGWLSNREPVLRAATLMN